MKVHLKRITDHLVQHLPFVLYSKPNSDTVLGLLQQDDTLYSVSDFNERGFLFASFDGNSNVIIPEERSDKISFEKDFLAVKVLEDKIQEHNENTRDNFEKLVQSGIEAINANYFKKIVLSRKESVSLVKFDLLDTFQKLLQLYPSAFVYCFYHPKIGTWLGASPEQLVRSNGKNFETVSLAGTQKDRGSGEIEWQPKEQEEQQIVTDYIVAKLQSVASNLKVSQPYSMKAGMLWHIKTKINAFFTNDSNLQQIVQLLHPTPAVCGLPKEEAKAFILKNEMYDRRYYTGFLGELNSEEISDSLGLGSDLFVNLRCMEIEGNVAHIYIGCGITKDSVAVKEWEESKNKSLTMKRVLN